MLSGTRTTLLTCLLLAGWASTHPAAGQDTADGGAEASETRQTTAPAPAEPEATASPGAAPRPGSPLEYEASEQISEDLSVSFPVDI